MTDRHISGATTISKSLCFISKNRPWATQVQKWSNRLMMSNIFKIEKMIFKNCNTSEAVWSKMRGDRSKSKTLTTYCTVCSKMQKCQNGFIHANIFFCCPWPRRQKVAKVDGRRCRKSKIAFLAIMNICQKAWFLQAKNERLPRAVFRDPCFTEVIWTILRKVATRLKRNQPTTVQVQQH